MAKSNAPASVRKTGDRPAIARAARNAPTAKTVADVALPATRYGTVYHPGSLLSITHLSLKELNHILALAADLESEPVASRAKRLLKRRVALLFYESSTRTRTSFELAAKSLGADTVLVSALSSSIEKGESLKDTGITLHALGAECIILRHPSSGAPYLLAHTTHLPILNAGDGMHEHPSQALLDLRTILTRRFGAKNNRSITEKTLAGTTVTIVGDILHSRVARSNALLLPRLGARVVLCGPEPLLPEAAAAIGPNVSIDRNLDHALAQSDVVMMLRIQKERLSGLKLDLDDYIVRYQLNTARLAAHAPKALVMHPGPMIRGLEMTSEAADGPQSAVAEQVHHGVAIRMALLARALEGTKKETRNEKTPIQTVKKSTKR
ncbi:MAG TPA: aspartate carbamoyltransferase catalytic subunit [Acidobacteriaceae bacterium]|jgi:aspartate carbamoyltransferase catalytic subunit|nr:aspartate carbamoyltransferase catalytic subunit [Acidobacteriaceae bacterium]